ARGLATIVLRPTRIYGPFSRTFTIRPLQALSHGQLAVGGNPDVPANMVYVDNVVAAIERALHASDNLNGSAYLISDPDQLSLRDFYEFFGKSSGLTVRVVPDQRVNVQGGKPGVLSQWRAGVVAIARSP